MYIYESMLTPIIKFDLETQFPHKKLALFLFIELFDVLCLKQTVVVRGLFNAD